MVFQDYALFPHKNVAQNVIFGLRMQGWKPARMEQRLGEVLILTGLKGYERRRIEQLSGGEQQRVALARALAPLPSLLLLDEPLGALDRALRERLMLELRAILKHAGPAEEGVTAVYVTHDQTEAFAIADRVAVMFAGKIEQVAAPMALYRQPATAEVARFLGMQNLLAGDLVSAGDSNRVRTAVGELEIITAPGEMDGQEVTVLLRPDSARLVRADSAELNRLSGRLTSVSFRGRYQIVTIEIGETRLRFELEHSEQLPTPGEAVHIAIDPARVQILPRR
jgi:ABC-type Fe3+/spermidine/putrescine transport system ATPase subunit